MARKTLFSRRVWKWAAPLAGLAVLGAALSLYFYKPRDKVYRLTLTAGDPMDTRYELAELLRDEVAVRGLIFDLQPTVGSEEALARGLGAAGRCVPGVYRSFEGDIVAIWGNPATWLAGLLCLLNWPEETVQMDRMELTEDRRPLPFGRRGRSCF